MKSLSLIALILPLILLFTACSDNPESMNGEASGKALAIPAIENQPKFLQNLNLTDEQWTQILERKVTFKKGKKGHKKKGGHGGFHKSWKKNGGEKQSFEEFKAGVLSGDIKVHHKKKGRKGNRIKKFLKHNSDILTEEQISKIKEFQATHKGDREKGDWIVKKIDRLGEKLELTDAQQESLTALWSTKKDEKKAILEKSNSWEEFKANKKEVGAGYEAKLQDILTEDQYKTFTELKFKHKGRWAKHHKGSKES